MSNQKGACFLGQRGSSVKVCTHLNTSQMSGSNPHQAYTSVLLKRAAKVKLYLLKKLTRSHESEHSRWTDSPVLGKLSAVVLKIFKNCSDTKKGLTSASIRQKRPFSLYIMRDGGLWNLLRICMITFRKYKKKYLKVWNWQEMSHFAQDSIKYSPLAE